MSLSLTPPDPASAVTPTRQTYAEYAEGEVTDEIALNPAYFAVVPLVETLQTLVHEMCHLWHHHNGTLGRAPDPAASASMPDSSDPGSPTAPPPVNRSNRIKYCCTDTCGAAVWGRSGLSLVCGVCRVPFG